MYIIVAQIQTKNDPKSKKLRFQTHKKVRLAISWFLSNKTSSEAYKKKKKTDITKKKDAIIIKRP